MAGVLIKRKTKNKYVGSVGASYCFTGIVSLLSVGLYGQYLLFVNLGAFLEVWGLHD